MGFEIRRKEGEQENFCQYSLQIKCRPCTYLSNKKTELHGGRDWEYDSLNLRVSDSQYSSEISVGSLSHHLKQPLILHKNCLCLIHHLSVVSVSMVIGMLSSFSIERIYPYLLIETSHICFTNSTSSRESRCRRLSSIFMETTSPTQNQSMVRVEEHFHALAVKYKHQNPSGAGNRELGGILLVGDKTYSDDFAKGVIRLYTHITSTLLICVLATSQLLVIYTSVCATCHLGS